MNIPSREQCLQILKNNKTPSNIIEHWARGAELVKKLGYPEVAKVISKHTLYKVEIEENQPKTFEEKIVFYADKRVKNDKVVSLEERYDDIKKRYDVDLGWEMEFTKKIEKELL
ncbi:hypothetical protein HYU50_03780 [Candidatus Woesearchaeota archaeon]|nr:hypothetical protein [Candidatus Woesearchaeota archaeon]